MYDHIRTNKCEFNPLMDGWFGISYLTTLHYLHTTLEHIHKCE